MVSRHGRSVGNRDAADFDFSVEVEPHTWQRRFTTYAESGTGWAGGDSTYSIALSDGRRLWLFSDTRLPNDRWVHNSVVVQSRSGELRTLHGGSRTEPTDLVPPLSRFGTDGMRRWLWTSDGIAVHDRLAHPEQHYVLTFYQRFRATKQNMGEWDFEWEATELVELSLPELRIRHREMVSDGTGVQWGAALWRIGGLLNVYGVLDEGDQKHLMLARASVSRPRVRWLYRTATGRWSDRPEDVGRILTGVSNEFSLLPAPGGNEAGWLLVTSDTRKPLGTWPIVTYWNRNAESDTWIGPYRIFDPPENDGQCYAYNPTAIPLTGTYGDEAADIVLVYNVNSTFAGVMQDPTIYRPRFRRVRISTRLGRQTRKL